jgi:ubiquinone/menaquinone biosynthesis C-methylase UbiE
MPTSTVTAPSTTGRVLHWACRYDLLVWLLTHGRHRVFREQQVALAHLAPDEVVLDVGCGTGSLAIAAKRQVGETGTVVGVDASPAMIARAAAKAARSNVDVPFRVGVAEALPFPDGHFDAVLSSLMLHHLPRTARKQCAREIRRVLKPGGRVLVVDFAHAQARTGFFAHFHRHGHVDPREVVSLLDEAGLRSIKSGPVGIGTLQFVLAVAERNVQRPDLRARTWLALVLGRALIAGHAGFLALAARGDVPGLLVGGGIVVAVVLKYAVWKHRRCRDHHL